MANIVDNWTTCKDKEFSNINENELLKRYHKAPEFLNSTQEESWNNKYKGVNFINTEYFENNTLCFRTKWKPISYEIIKELSRDFEYCLYEWYEENGIGARVLFYKGELYREYEYTRFCWGQSHEDEEFEDLWSFDKFKADRKATKIIAKREKQEAKKRKEMSDGLPF